MFFGVGISRDLSLGDTSFITDIEVAGTSRYQLRDSIYTSYKNKVVIDHYDSFTTENGKAGCP